MNLFEKIRKIAARHARARQIYAEMSAITDPEMRELDLSPAKIAELSRQQAASV